jgi:putative spermidine/putrescine transport system substrate-binding protein
MKCRRLFVLLLAVLSAGTMWAGLSSAQTNELVIAAWGDPYKAGWQKSLIPEFEKKYNAKLIWVEGFSTQTLAKLRAQKDHPEVDIAMMDDGPHRQAVALGLVDRIDRSKLDNTRDLYPIAFEPEDYGMGFAVTASGLYYNTKAFAENHWAPPTSWLDLYRPELRGKVSVHNIGNANGINLLLALNKIAGGTDTNVDPGFAKLKELVPNVVTFDKFGETPTLIQQGTAVLGTWNIDRVANLAASGVPVEFVYPKEGVWGWKEVVTLVKGRPHTDLAYKFIDMMLSKEQQENNAKFIGFGPVNSATKLDPETAKKVLYGNEYVSKVIIPNWQVVNANRPAWTERWNKEIERR